MDNRYGGLEAYKKATDYNWATEAFYHSFERGSIHRMPERKAAAREYYDKWHAYQAEGNGDGKATGTYVFPVGKGFQRFTTRSGDTNGASDIAAPTGTPVFAVDGGTVIYAGPGQGFTYGDWTYGNIIVIDHGASTESRYAHLSAISVRTGSKVSKGQQIGAVGFSGRVIPSGPGGAHLHFEFKLKGRWRYSPGEAIRNGSI